MATLHSLRLWTALAFLAGISGIVPSAHGEELILSGSSMLYPANLNWARGYERTHPGVRIRVAAPGSGAGIAGTSEGDVSIGASDIYLSSRTLAKKGNIVLIPVALEGVVPVVNLPPSFGRAPLRLDGPLLSRLLSGRIAFWDDPRIIRKNPGRSLPHLPVLPVVRADASGTTYLLTDYLAHTCRWWRDNVGREPLPEWPRRAKVFAVSGSRALVSAVRAREGTIGYVGLGWLRRSKLVPVALENDARRMVAPSVRAIGKAAERRGGRMVFPDGFNRSLVGGGKDPGAWPVTGVEFWMVSPDLPEATMDRVRHLAVWVLTRGQAPAYTTARGFVPLPDLPAGPRLMRRLKEILPGNSFRPTTAG